ncbi:hypothetical protein ACFYVL_31550 [Streptomyces sp. NPDC004111]|uniref:hypothetical protein n=1 Tax=Streptomyces sp. NPDC004111 TaxID=3364690 RepID=UPI0036B37CEE
MSDALGFPVLAASALTQAIGFLYRRAEAVLDRRAARRGAGEPHPPEEIPEVVAGEPGGERDFDPGNVTDDRVHQLETLLEVLALYEEQGLSLNGQDERLRRTLGRIRALLEEIYQRRITFVGEDRPASGRRIVARAGDVHGVSRALKARRAGSGATFDVEHTAEVIHPGGEMTSVEIDDLN